MLPNSEVPMSRLARFYAEVTDRGAEACLPRNLSEEWLDVLSAAVETLLSDPDQDENSSEPSPEAKAMVLASVLLILSAKRAQPHALRISLEEFMGHLNNYRLELALEMVHRRTDVKYEPASLETIFTNREVRTWKEAP
jgi:hypothetical protein